MKIDTDVVVIGAGLTGLTTAYWLSRSNIKVHVVERNAHVGGQIQTHVQGDFIFESGPTTSSISTPEVAELMTDLAETSNGKCLLETAIPAAKRRLIWKGNRLHALPSGPLSAISTPLFRWSDKFRILGEPWRKKGNNPDETVGQLVSRRLGKSFVDYAVDPFVSGVYAGDPYSLVTRHALPKLYNLEQDYGSFIKGSIAKAKIPKTPREKLATKQVFSAHEGLSHIPQAEAEYVGSEYISLNARNVQVNPTENGWQTSFLNADGTQITICSKKVVTTCGAYALTELLPFISEDRLAPVTSLRYAPVMEVNVGVSDCFGGDYNAFGALVPSCEHRKILGILFPSACFEKRAPKGGALFAFFIGGTKHPEMLELTDGQVEELVVQELHEVLKFPKGTRPEHIHISRHQKAIPQYELSTEKRLSAVRSLESEYPGLVLAGNLRDGIGMGHRMTQATNITKDIIQQLKK